MNVTARALLAEAVGSFLFFSVGAGSIIANEMTGGDVGLVGIALAHGIALAVVVSIFAGISGGHVNPAVSLGLALAKVLPWKLLLPYWAAQLAGGVLAGLFLVAAFPAAVASAAQLGTPQLGAGIAPATGVLVEAVLTFFLVLAVFGTLVSPSAPRIAGFGIGSTLMVAILAGGPLTGAALNPARHTGPALVGLFLDDWWVYWIGPLIGGAAASLAYRFAFSPRGGEPAG